MVENTKDQGSAHDQSNASSEDVGNKGTVPLEAHRVLLGDHVKVKDKNKTLEAQLREFQDKEAAARESKLKEAGNFTALLEDREKQIQSVKDQLAEITKQNQILEKTQTESRKLNAFNRALGGKIADKEYYDLVKLDKIAVDPVSGDIDESSLKAYVKEFTDKHKRVIDFGGAKLPDQAAQRVDNVGQIRNGDFMGAMKEALLKR